MGRLYDALNILLPHPEQQSKQTTLLPVDVPDLALAYRELGKLALADGDLGAEYWNRVIKLLEWAEAVHREAVSER